MINGLSIVGPAVRGEVGSVLDFKGGRGKRLSEGKGWCSRGTFCEFRAFAKGFSVIFVRQC